LMIYWFRRGGGGLCRGGWCRGKEIVGVEEEEVVDVREGGLQLKSESTKIVTDYVKWCF
jgi:hypothetical protein